MLQQVLLLTGSSSSGPDPDSFNFADQTDVDTSTVITSDTITLTGGFFNKTVTRGAGCDSFSVNGGSFIAGPLNSVYSGDTLAIKQTSSASNGHTTTATISVGATDSTWSVTTMSSQPDSFNFTNQPYVDKSTAITSDTVTLSGGFSNKTATCTNCTVSINGGSFVSGPVTGVDSGDTLAIKQTASSSFGTTTNASVIVGTTGSGNWGITTIPDPAGFNNTAWTTAKNDADSMSSAASTVSSLTITGRAVTYGSRAAYATFNSDCSTASTLANAALSALNTYISSASAAHITSYHSAASSASSQMSTVNTDAAAVKSDLIGLGINHDDYFWGTFFANPAAGGSVQDTVNIASSAISAAIASGP